MHRLITMLLIGICLAVVFPTKAQHTNYRDSIKEIARNYFNEGNFSLSLKLHQQLFDSALQAKDSVLIAEGYFQIGRLYYYMQTEQSYAQGLEYFAKVLELGKQIPDKKVTARAHRAIGVIIGEDGKYSDTSKYHLKMAEKLTLELEDYKAASEIQSILGSYESTASIDSLAHYLDLAIVNAYKSGDADAIDFTEQKIGVLHYYKKEYEQAETYYEKVRKRLRERGVKDSEINVLRNLRNLYKTQNRWDDYIRVADRLDSLRQDLYSEQYAKEFNDARERYEADKKEQELRLVKSEQELQQARIQRFRLLIVILVIVAVVVTLLIFFYQSKKRAALKLVMAEEREALQQIRVKAVIDAEEKERKRISKELHDGIGQQLSALKLNLTHVSQQVKDQEQREQLQELTKQFSQSADEVRQISHQMMPRVLLDNGLTAAIEELLRSCFQFSPINYTFEHYKIDQRFDERIEISLYRILQELINNVIKHSEATEVAVQLIRNSDRLLLFVEDNGKGIIDRKNDGHGMHNINSRLAMIKGSVTFEPGPNQGTSAIVAIPVEIDEAEVVKK